MHWTRGVAIIALAGLAGLGDAAPSDGSATASAYVGAPSVVVRAAASEDAQTACEGARRALAFLAGSGLEAPAHLAIDIVPALPGDLAGKAVGCYLPGMHRIVLLSFEAFQAEGSWFRMPPSRALYQAAASHEVAHAVAGCHSEPRRLAVAAHEYVAYVVFFATMDAPLRSTLLQRFAGPGLETAGQINDWRHLTNPNQFGVDAWRHDLKVAAGDRDRWLQRVIAGEVVPDVIDDPGAATR